MSKKLFGVMAISVITLIACDDDNKNDEMHYCDNKEVGVISTNLFEAQRDENMTHRDGFCLKSEKCVTILGTNGERACSAYEQGHILCNSNVVNATTDNNNCGQCGKTCQEGEVCSEGNCSCTENAKQCTINGDARVCKNGSWEVQQCTDGCKDGACNEHICDANDKKCSENNSSILICANNSWSTEENCDYKCEESDSGPVCIKKVCTEGETKCNSENEAALCTENAWHTTSCSEGCTDGKCNEPICIKSGDFQPPYSPDYECCDKDAKKYIYLFNSKNNCNNDNPVEFNHLDNFSYSFNYCLTDAQVNDVKNSDKCLILAENFSHLSNEAECGLSKPYKTCDGKDTQGAQIETCYLGECCVQEGTKSYSSLMSEDCCTGQVYFYASSGGGHYYTCSDDENYCKINHPNCADASSKCTCEQQ